ncbi:hypothetical protein ANANG_G00314720, partial [Anguilla anguilla]
PGEPGLCQQGLGLRVATVAAVGQADGRAGAAAVRVPPALQVGRVGAEPVLVGVGLAPEVPQRQPLVLELAVARGHHGLQEGGDTAGLQGLQRQASAAHVRHQASAQRVHNGAPYGVDAHTAGRSPALSSPDPHRA